MTFNQGLLLFYICAVVIFSIVAFVAFLRDKKLAIKGSERTKEKTLLFLSIFFGGIGALLGRIVARHKTDKIYFSLVIYLSTIYTVLLVVFLTLLAF